MSNASDTVRALLPGARLLGARLLCDFCDKDARLIVVTSLCCLVCAEKIAEKIEGLAH